MAQRHEPADSLDAAVAAAAVDPAHTRRPTVLAAAVTRLCAGIVDRCRHLTGADDFGAVNVALAAVSDAMAVLTDSPRSPRRLAATVADLQATAASLRTPTPAPAPRQARLVLTVPGPDATLPRGLVVCETERGRRTLRWVPAEPGYAQGVALHLLSEAFAGPYRLAERSEWDRAANDITVVVCGYLTSPLPAPTLLQWAAARLGRELWQTVRHGEWVLDADQIRSFLEDTGHVVVGDEGGVVDAAAERTRQHLRR